MKEPLTIELRAQLQALGLTLRELTIYHWQLTGWMRPINIYMNAKNNMVKIYINGAEDSIETKGRRVAYIVGTIIRDQVRTVATSKVRRRWMPEHKRRLLRADPRCHWCAIGLDDATATVDHVVPISRGGSNREDNLVLACDPCNKARGNQLTGAALGYPKSGEVSGG